ncbi:MAG: PAS domain S-box protein, partial [Bacteroidia bacterium]|nr:PAS domain S-box protein [Bacteroidia bacterium]
MFSNIPGIIYRRKNNESWSMILLSSHFKDLTGFKPDDFLDGKRSILELIHPDDIDRVKITIQSSILAHKPFTLDYQVFDISHKVKWVRENGQGIYDEAGDLLYVDGVIYDITQQKELDDNLRKALEQSRKQEEQLRQNAEILQATQIELTGRIDALNNSGMISETDSEGIIIFVNDEAIRTWGYTRKEILGNTHRIIKSEHHGAEFFTNLWKTIQSGKVWKGEIKNRAKDGTDFWENLTITPVLGQNGIPVKYIAVAFDITRQKRQASRIKVFLEDTKKQEEMMRKYAVTLEEVQEKMLKTQIELAGQISAMNHAAMVTECDVHGSISFINDSALQTWGYTKDEVLGKNHNIIKSGTHSAEFFAEMYSKISKGKVWQGEIHNKAKDGSDFWIRLTITPVYDQNANLYKYIGVSFDITQQKLQAQRIKQSLKQSQQQEETYIAEIHHLKQEKEQLTQQLEQTTFKSEILDHYFLTAVLDTNGKFQAVNHRFCEETGFSEEELSELTLAHVLDSDSLKQLTEIRLWKRLKAGEWIDAEFSLVGKQKTIPMKASFAPELENSTNQVVAVYMVATENAYKLSPPATYLLESSVYEAGCFLYLNDQYQIIGGTPKLLEMLQ